MVVKGGKHPWILSHNTSAFQRFPKCLIHHCPRPRNDTICPQSRKLRKGKSFDFLDFVSWIIAQLPSYPNDVCFSPAGSGCAHTRALLQMWAEYRDGVWTKGRSPFSWACPVRPFMASVSNGVCFPCIQSWCVLSSLSPIFPRLSFDSMYFRKHGCVLTTAGNFNFLVPYIRRWLCHGKSLGLSLCLYFST